MVGSVPIGSDSADEAARAEDAAGIERVFECSHHIKRRSLTDPDGGCFLQCGRSVKTTSVQAARLEEGADAFPQCQEAVGGWHRRHRTEQKVGRSRGPRKHTQTEAERSSLSLEQSDRIAMCRGQQAGAYQKAFRMERPHCLEKFLPAQRGGSGLIACAGGNVFPLNTAGQLLDILT